MGYPESQYIIDEVLNGYTKSQSSGIPPKKAVLSVNPIANGCEISIEVSDTFLKNSTMPICSVKGVLVRIKHNELPQDINDGDLVGNFGLDELANISVHDLTYGEKYYVRVWPYSTHNVYNVDETQSAEFTAIGEDNRIFGFHQNFTVLDPNNSITYIETNADYTPMYTITDDSSNEKTLGSWSNWLWLVRNKPYFVGIDGIATDSLDADDYSKKADGTDSGISTYSTGGVFAWFPAIYMKEVYSEDGNSRDVYFCLSKREGFNNVGFYNTAGEELSGLWFPMFYPNTNGKIVLSSSIKTGLSVDGINDFLTSSGYTSPVCFGGPLYNCLRDILYMLYKTTDIASKAGYGNSGSSLGDYILTDGAFYGTSSGNKKANKIFHSAILGSYFNEILDPYVAVSNSKLKISKNYNTESMSELKDMAPSSYKARTYPLHLEYLGDGYGSFFKLDDTEFGSNKAGLCSSLYWPSIDNPATEILVRTQSEDENQFYKFSFFRAKDYTFSNGSVGIMLVPATDYVPYSE